MHDHLSTSQMDIDLDVVLSTIHTGRYLHSFYFQLILFGIALQHLCNLYMGNTHFVCVCPLEDFVFHLKTFVHHPRIQS